MNDVSDEELTKRLEEQLELYRQSVQMQLSLTLHIQELQSQIQLLKQEIEKRFPPQT